MTRNTAQLDEATVTALTRANNRMVLPLAVGVLGSIFLAVAFMMQNEFNAKLETVTAWYLLASFFILVGATVFNVMFWNYIELKNQTKAPPPPDMPTHNSPTFESDVRPPRMMVQTSHNQWLLSRYTKINQRQWGRLIDALANNDWYWSRDHALRPAKIFTADETGIILDNEFNELTADFERMKIIQRRAGRWPVTEFGIEALHELAGRQPPHSNNTPSSRARKRYRTPDIARPLD